METSTTLIGLGLVLITILPIAFLLRNQHINTSKIENILKQYNQGNAKAFNVRDSINNKIIAFDEQNKKLVLIDLNAKPEVVTFADLNEIGHCEIQRKVEQSHTATKKELITKVEVVLEKKYTIKNIILEVDLNINSEGYSEGTRARFMPYLKSNETVANYYNEIIPEFKSLYYLPFYRFIRNDAQIGFRQMFFSMINKPSADLLNEGFYALQGEGQNMKYDLTKYAPKRNKDYELIKNLCKTNNINLIVVSTPMCSSVKGIRYFEKIKNIYPEVHNCEHYVTEDKYFSSCGHMNEAGARVFTAKIIEDFFSTKSE